MGLQSFPPSVRVSLLLRVYREGERDGVQTKQIRAFSGIFLFVEPVPRGLVWQLSVEKSLSI